MVLVVVGIILYLYLAQKDRHQYQTRHRSYIRKPWEHE